MEWKIRLLHKALLKFGLVLAVLKLMARDWFPNLGKINSQYNAGHNFKPMLESNITGLVQIIVFIFKITVEV